MAKQSTPTLRVIHLTGTEAEMGAQFGELMRGSGRYNELTHHFRHLGLYLIRCALPQKIRTNSLVNQMILRFMDSWTWQMARNRPDAGRARHMAALRVMGKPEHFGQVFFSIDAVQNIVNLASIFRRYYIPEVKLPVVASSSAACSTAMCWDRATKDGNLLHARNFDFPAPGIWDNQQALVFCTPPSGLRYGYIASYGTDVPGITGFNEAGISISVHTRFHSNFSLQGTGICDFGHELIRRASTLKEAIQVAEEYSTYSTWAISISSAREKSAIVLEKAGRYHGIVRPTRDYLLSTNHCLSPEMQLREVSPTAVFVDHSRARLEILESVVDSLEAQGGATVADLQELLFCHKQAGSAPENGGLHVVAGSIVRQPYMANSVVIDPDNTQVHIGTGSVSKMHPSWKTIPWSWDKAPGAALIPIEHGHNNVLSGYQTFAEAYQSNLYDADSEPALEAVLQAYTESPSDPTLQFLSGVALLRRGQHAEAAERLAIAATSPQRDFRRGQALYWAAQAERLLGRQSDAKAYFQELANLSEPLLLQYQSQQNQKATAAKLAKKPQDMIIDLSAVEALI